MRTTNQLVLAATVLLSLALLLTITGASGRTKEEVVARNVTIVDSSGTPRMTLTTGDDDQPRLEMFDRRGTAVVSLTLGTSDEPSLEFMNVDGTTQLSLSLVNGDLPWLEMKSKGNEDVVDLGLNSYGAPSLEMSDAAYTRHADIRFDESGYFGFAAYGPEYEDRLRVGLNNDGLPAVELFGADEQRLASFDLHDNRPYLTLWDDRGDAFLEVPGDILKLQPASGD